MHDIIVGMWRAARAEQDDITEDEAREALLELDPLWDELFPAEQARIVQLLVERVDVRMHGVEVRLRPNGLAGLVREVAGAGGPRHDAGDGCRPTARRSSSTSRSRSGGVAGGSWW